LGSISASPRLVPSGGTTNISWSVTDAASCTVSGNGNTWTGVSCDDGDTDAVQDDLTDSVNIYRVPSWLAL
jgi:hypothetical protein